ncbi:hypothetical protein PJE062_2496 [Pseudovibrio sp. JE062]|nr:hypothetical protein PJE062_2496 [Pseudovibrio sp. JE062]
MVFYCISEKYQFSTDSGIGPKALWKRQRSHWIFLKFMVYISHKHAGEKGAINAAHSKFEPLNNYES